MQFQDFQRRDASSMREVSHLHTRLEVAHAEAATTKAEKRAERQVTKTILGSISQEVFGLPPCSTDWSAFAKRFQEFDTAVLPGAHNAIAWTIETSSKHAESHFRPSMLFATEACVQRIIPLRTLAFGLRAAVDVEMSDPFCCPRVLQLLNDLDKSLARADKVPAGILSDILCKLVEYGSGHYGKGYGQYPMAMATVLAVVQSMSFLRGRFGVETLQDEELEMRKLLRRAWPTFEDCISLVSGVGPADVEEFMAYHEQRCCGHVCHDSVTLRDSEDRKYFAKVDCDAQRILVAALEGDHEVLR